MLRCVCNPANPSGMRRPPSFLTRCAAIQTSRETASAEAVGEGGGEEGGGQSRDRRSGNRDEYKEGRKDVARREERRVHKEVERDDAAPSASFRVELCLYGLSEIVSCGRASTPYPPPNIAISSASSIRRTFVDFRDANTRHDDRQRWEIEVWNFRLHDDRQMSHICLTLRLHLPHFDIN